MRTVLRTRPRITELALPSQYAGLVGWWKADAISALNDGDAVASWADSSGAGNALAQAVALNRPVYKTNIKNGLAVVRFTAASLLYLTCDALAASVSGTGKAFSLAFVAKPNSAGAGTIWSSGKLASGNPYERLFNAPNCAITKRDDASVSVGPSSRIFAAGTWSVGMAILTGANVYTRLDGTQFATAADGTTACTQDEFTVGAWRRTSLADYWDGDIAELAFWNVALTEKQMRSVENGLRAKWAVAMR